MPMYRDRAGVENAKEIAVEILSFLASRTELMRRFVETTGVDPGEIRALVRQQAFLCAITEFLASEESILAEFVKQTRRDAAAVEAARRALCGPNWEREIA